MTKATGLDGLSAKILKTSADIVPCVNFCSFSLLPGVKVWLWFVIVALPEIFY